MASVSLEQKRLEQLKQQVFGKDESSYKLTSRHISQTTQTTTSVSVDANLKSDLLKISLLTILALGIQFSLFLANQNGLIKLFNW